MKKSAAAKWRTMAARARSRADGMKDAGPKRTMLEIAMAYEALARRADALAAHSQLSAPDENKPNDMP